MSDAKAILDECGMNAKHADPKNLRNPNQPAPHAKNVPEFATTGECCFNSFPLNGMLPTNTSADVAK